MLFTWNTENLCIVFEGWHVNGTGSLIGSLIGVILLTAGYELVREISRRYEAGLQRKVKASDLSKSIPLVPLILIMPREGEWALVLGGRRLSSGVAMIDIPD
jgi:ABC-type branched-subunit amino acid transport system permease subunit